MTARTLICALTLLLAACVPGKDSCTELTDQLQRCGFQVSDLDCNRLDPADLGELSQGMAERGCKAVTKGDDTAVDPRLCLLANWPCPDSPIPPPGNIPPRYPLVFVSGIDSTPIFDWNPRILEAVKQVGGTEAFHVQVIPWSTTPERAADLWESLVALRRHLAATRLNLVCYAVAGLDCRYLASPGGLFRGDPASYEEVQASIASITTIATPHRGTRVADAALDALQSNATSDLLQTLLGTSTALQVPDSSALHRTLEGLTLDALSEFNQRITDAPGIDYQSWAGVSQILARTSASTEQSIRQFCTGPDGALLFMRHPDTRDALNELLWATAPFSNTTRDESGHVVYSPSDGMIAVASAKWGVFRGCIPADHYDVIGQIGHTTRDPLTGFDAPAFYAYLASDLAARGF